jgi:hypothetical protein
MLREEVTAMTALPIEHRRAKLPVSLPSRMTGAVAVVGALLIATSRPCSAGTEVQGQADEMQLTAQNASVKEIFEALSAKFTLIYKLPPNIGHTVTGRYAGTLRQVLGRILDGNDYIVTIVDGRVDVVVLGASGATAGATPAGIAIVAPAAPIVSSNQPSARIPAAASVTRPPVVPAGSSPPPLATYVPR